MSIEQEFADKLVQYKHIIYKVCFMYADNKDDILEDCEHNELLKEMYSLIKRLNKVDRMFILLWLDEKSYDEIAGNHRTNRNNVADKPHRI